MTIDEAVAATKPILSLLRELLGSLPKRSKDHLLFVEQAGCWWAYLDEPSGIQLHFALCVTNASKADGLIICRVQVQRTGWRFLLHKDPWQDCGIVDVGKERLFPMFVGPLLSPKATAIMRILHHHKSPQPKPKRPIKFRLRVTDQRGRVHATRLTVPPRAV